MEIIKKLTKVIQEYDKLIYEDKVIFIDQFQLVLNSAYEDLKSSTSLINLYPEILKKFDFDNLFDISPRELLNAQLVVGEYISNILDQGKKNLSETNLDCNDILNYYLSPGMVEGLKQVDSLIKQFENDSNLENVGQFLKSNLIKQRVLYESPQLLYARLKLELIEQNQSLKFTDNQLLILHKEAKGFIYNQFCLYINEFLFDKFNLESLEINPIQSLIKQIEDIFTYKNDSFPTKITLQEMEDKYMISKKFQGFNFIFQVNKQDCNILQLRIQDLHLDTQKNIQSLNINDLKGITDNIMSYEIDEEFN